MASALQEDLFTEKENKPYFSNESRVLEKYWKCVEPKLKAYLKENLDYVPSFDDLEVEVAKLPTMYGEDGSGKVSKVLGAYNPGERKIYLDPIIFKEMDDPERKKLGYKEDADETFMHELIHHVQRNLGSLHRQPRWYTEGVATKVTEDITRKRQRTYPEETKEVEDLSKHFTPEELLKGARKLNLN